MVTEMKLSRRGVLAGGAASSIAPRFSLAETTADGFQIIRAEAVDVNLLSTSSGKAKLWRFADAQGPVTVLRAKQGEEFRARFVNTLDVDIWLHWFGIRGPDGVMTLTIEPGEDKPVDCVFTPPDAGTFWFGPLTDASHQREMGLYGMLIVEGQDDSRFHDLPLILDDWKVNDDGQLTEDFGSLEDAIASGRLGNWFTVNGAYRPQLSAPADKPLRLRLLNAANVRTMQMQIKGANPRIAALDGQPIVPKLVRDAPMVLAAGQRADLIIDSSSEGLSLALDLFEDLVELCTIERTGSTDLAVLEPAFALKSNPIATTLDIQAATVVAVALEGGAKGGMKSARFNGLELDLKSLVERGKVWAVNGVVGPGGDPIGRFVKGATVILEIENKTAFDQPLHVHGHVWRDLAADDSPWRDTGIARAGTITRFGFIADNPGTWALQSLVAERSDSGLICAFTVS
jgi:FtsP/CotA-like multicopper oxidase with cupredoxin domain